MVVVTVQQLVDNIVNSVKIKIKGKSEKYKNLNWGYQLTHSLKKTTPFIMRILFGINMRTLYMQSREVKQIK